MSAPRPPRRPALGRGLSSLIGTPDAGGVQAKGRRVLEVGIERLSPQRGQPRRHFDDEALAELCASIKERGVLLPILVRRQGGAFQIIAGERRWRAAQKAGLSEVPVVVEEADDDEAFELALIENLQRQDLTPIEEALAYRRLMERGPATQAEVAAKVGKRRSTVANALRLLKLPEAVLEAVGDGRLSMGHARALLAARPERIEALARQVLAEGLSVRATEALVRRERPRVARRSKGGAKAAERSAATRDLERRLEQRLGCKVRIDDRGGRGQVTLRYASLDDLDRLIGVLMGE